jgi:Mg2+ and Co2+ transporter CorA
VEVRWIGPAGLERHGPEAVEKLLAREDGFLWLDIPEPDGDAGRLLAETFRFHRPALRDCSERSIVPKIRPYPDHVFTILHAPEPGLPGQIRLVELDQFLGPNYLVTVHGPAAEEISRETLLRETDQVAAQIERGQIRPATPIEVSHAIVSLIAQEMERLVGTIAGRVANLEQRVLRGKEGDPQDELEEMLRLRHQLLTIRTMAKGSQKIYAGMASVRGPLPAESRPHITDLADRFDGVAGLCEGERDFMQGVLDLYRDRRAARMNRAMERLALISSFALPLTLIASIYGMNTILNPRTDLLHTGIILGAMVTLTVLLYRYTKRQGWW